MADVKEQYFGTFTLKNDTYPGVVSLAGSGSSLELFSERLLSANQTDMIAIQGISKDGKRLTACNCVGPGISGRATYYGPTRYFMSLFPHYVAIGPRHLHVTKKEITHISYTFPDAISLFYDWGSFGQLPSSRASRIPIPVRSRQKRKIQRLHVFYYADRGEIIRIDDPQLSIKANNVVSIPFPTPRGIRIENQVRISLDFVQPQTLDQAIIELYQLHFFFELLTQSKQPVHNVLVRHATAESHEPGIHVYISNADRTSSDTVHPGNVLISGGLHKDEFERVFSNWRRGNSELRRARQRVINGFREGFQYTIDRFVGSANAFDLLPRALWAKRKALPKSAQTKIDALCNDAKSLKPEYRIQVVNNLKRVKELALREKILIRHATLPIYIRRRLPRIENTIDHCVLMRNYFVHGGNIRIPLDLVDEFVPFFTDTLEFIFVVSDLYSCGWNAKRWSNNPSTGRLRSYLTIYNEHEPRLRRVEKQKQIRRPRLVGS
jgi:hypothetical protein